MTKIKKFQLLEDLKKQGDEVNNKREEYRQAVEDAKQALKQAEIELDEAVTVEITSGKTNAKAKTTAHTKVEKARQALEIAKQTRATAERVLEQPSDITRSQVVESFVHEYLPAVKAEGLPSIQQRMEQGQALILSALHDYNELKDAYSPIVEEMKRVNDAAVAREGMTSVAFSRPFANHREDSGFDQHKFASLLTQAQREMPKGVEYIKEPFTTTKTKGNK